MTITETHVNESKGYFICEPETFKIEEFTTLADIYHHYSKIAGRCTSKMYTDTKDGPLHIGYVFEKREAYADCNETYLHSLWVELAE